MSDKEQKLLEGFSKLPPDSQDFILSTVITAVTAQEATLRELKRNGDASYALPGPGPVMGVVHG
jgi:hypothetical protein